MRSCFFSPFLYICHVVSWQALKLQSLVSTSLFLASPALSLRRDVKLHRHVKVNHWRCIFFLWLCIYVNGGVEEQLNIFPVPPCNHGDHSFDLTGQTSWYKPHTQPPTLTCPHLSDRPRVIVNKQHVAILSHVVNTHTHTHTLPQPLIHCFSCSRNFKKRPNTEGSRTVCVVCCGSMREECIPSTCHTHTHTHTFSVPLAN